MPKDGLPKHLIKIRCDLCNMRVVWISTICVDNDGLMHLCKACLEEHRSELIPPKWAPDFQD